MDAWFVDEVVFGKFGISEKWKPENKEHAQEFLDICNHHLGLWYTYGKENHPYSKHIYLRIKHVCEQFLYN